MSTRKNILQHYASERKNVNAVEETKLFTSRKKPTALKMAEKYHDTLVCPITFTLFSDPVVAEDGHTYERSAITEWIHRNKVSPLTRQPISIEALRPNHIVRSLVDEFKNDLSKHKYKFTLGVDIERSENSFFKTTGKSLYKAKWINKTNGPSIVLLKLEGARAEKEAYFYEHLTRHPNIVRTYGLVDHPQQHADSDLITSVMLLQEGALIGNLHDFLENRIQNPFSDILLNHMFFQITDAMVYLSYNAIIHGDLACRNVLVFCIDEEEPRKTVVKLTDFGISRGNTIYSKIDAITTMIDTVPIRTSAPEVLQNTDQNAVNVYSEKSDMYAMGVLMWVAYSNGLVPWYKISRESVIRQTVISGERLSRPTNCKSDRQWELILKCMSQKPEDRPTFLDLKGQLTEFLTPVIHSSVEEDKASTSTPTMLPIVEQQTKEIDKSPPCSTIIDETEKINSDNNNKTEEISPLFTGVSVGNKRLLFENKIKEHVRPSSSNRSKANISSELSSTPLLPKKSIVKTITPREELIQLTKWH